MTIDELIENLQELKSKYGEGRILTIPVDKISPNQVNCIDFIPNVLPVAEEFKDVYYNRISIMWKNDDN